MDKSQLELLDEAGLIAPSVHAVRGRSFRTASGAIVVDFCGTNYLGFDQDARLVDTGIAFAREWGSNSPWARLEADLAAHPAFERELATFLGASRVLCNYSITLLNLSIIPAIAKSGVIFTDKKVHAVVYEACRLARDHGAAIVPFAHQDLNALEDALKANRARSPKLIAIDGVYSISTEHAPLRELRDLCERYDAYLYVDDAHGFGVVGDGPTAGNPYGVGGAGMVRHAGISYDRVFYVSSFGKAFCTYGSFMTVPPELGNRLFLEMLSNVYSAPIAPYLLGTCVAALALNRELGEQRRATMRARVRQLASGLTSLGYEIENLHEQPVVFVRIGAFAGLVRASEHLKRCGIHAGMRPYPVVPKDQCGLRFALTAVHSEADVTKALEAMSDPKILGLVTRRGAA